jgi:heptaprenyl diphosphate synthase
MIGGVMHNAGQILVAIFIVENARVGYYFFVLAISGLVTGLVIGLISGELVRRMRIAIRNDGSL